MKTKRSLTIAAIVVALAALLTITALRGTRIARAQDRIPPPQPERISFGMVGITPGQTLRVNVSNVVATNDSGYPPGPTRVAIIIINSHGDPFRHRDGSPVRRVVMLDRGESAFLDLNGDDLQYPPGPSRLQLRAIVNLNPPGPPDQPPPTDGVPPPIGEQAPPVPDRIMTSVEVFNNNNGRTVFALAAPPSVRAVPPPVPE